MLYYCINIVVLNLKVERIYYYTKEKLAFSSKFCWVVLWPQYVCYPVEEKLVLLPCLITKSGPCTIKLHQLTSLGYKEDELHSSLNINFHVNGWLPISWCHFDCSFEVILCGMLWFICQMVTSVVILEQTVVNFR